MGAPDMQAEDGFGVQAMLHSAEVDRYQRLSFILRKFKRAQIDGYCFDYEFDEICAEVGIEI